MRNMTNNNLNSSEEDLFDVVVCGGGPAGMIAATTAARAGFKVALIERYGFLGGMATAGLVDPISRFYLHGEKVIGGIPWEFVDNLVKLGGAEVETPAGNVSFHPEYYKLCAQRMVLQAGVYLFLHATIVNVETNIHQISSVVIHTKQGDYAIKGRYIIDCTGDADVAWMAGAKFQKKSEALQPASLCFMIGNVDTNKLPLRKHTYENVNMQDPDLRQMLFNLSNKGVKVPQFGGPWYCSMIENGYLIVNITRYNGDMTDIKESTRAECQLREDVFYFVDILRNNTEAFKNACLLTTASQVGVRETRRICGDYILTGDEYLDGKHFTDSIARGCHPIDIHRGKDDEQTCHFIQKAGFVPYRCLYSDDFTNLLVAGRCISTDETASASLRVQASCMQLGQAAGTAASVCLKDKCSVQKVDTQKIRNTMIETGALL